MTASQYLSTFLNYEKNLAKLSTSSLYLQRVHTILKDLGSPQENLKVIHIAGSKGKGSTAAFTAKILQIAGYKVGIYTSPHLYHVTERICINDKAISDKNLTNWLKRIRPQLESGRKHGLTYFEVLTIVAFCYFKEQKADWVVLETGLGGRLDATNVCDAAVSVITPISLEHTKQLGNTLAKIAAEKAAIIKSAKSKVITAPQKSEVLKVIEGRCKEIGVRMIAVKQGIKGVSPSLIGQHQKINAAVAAKIAEVLKISKENIKRGLETTSWPLRFEVVRRRPTIVLDGAHNPESCRHLTATLREEFPGKKWILIFGSSNDKDITGMLRVLSAGSREVIYSHARHPRAKVWKDKSISVSSACRKAEKIVGPDDIIVVAGSLFVAAEARTYFKK